MPFQFNPVNAHLRDLNFNSIVKVRSGEALAFISVLNLHVLLAEDDRIDAQFGLNKDSKNIKHCKHADEFLAKLCSLSPKLVMLVEQESNHNSQKLVDRFVEGLPYYSAMFDSINVAFKGDLCEERLLVEEMIGKEIENIVACDGLEREERHEKFANWMVRLGHVNFRPVRLWGDTMDDAIRFVESYGGDGYKISSQRGSLIIGWHDRPIYSVSGWTCFN
nr:scarecrow-like protein 3 [Ipomoea batatas]